MFLIGTSSHTFLDWLSSNQSNPFMNPISDSQNNSQNSVDQSHIQHDSIFHDSLVNHDSSPQLTNVQPDISAPVATQSVVTQPVVTQNACPQTNVTQPDVLNSDKTVSVTKRSSQRSITRPQWWTDYYILPVTKASVNTVNYVSVPKSIVSSQVILEPQNFYQAVSQPQ